MLIGLSHAMVKFKSFCFLCLCAMITSTFSASLICFRQRPGGTILYPTTFKECYEIQKFLLRRDKPHAPLTFSRKPGIGYKVPDYWTVGNCALIIDMHSDDEEDTMSFADIAVETGAVNAGCVARPPHFGGTFPVGPKKVMNVTLIGSARSQLGLLRGRPTIGNISIS
ncbi:MAG: hypothetical protein LQ338_006801 [Usnochroma carphineum]|nr:MAG: hypothetical protein LQ338_006801 [Usnochroma carphineum]